jgi:hypothetical protein
VEFAASSGTQELHLLLANGEHPAGPPPDHRQRRERACLPRSCCVRPTAGSRASSPPHLLCPLLPLPPRSRSGHEWAGDAEVGGGGERDREEGSLRHTGPGRRRGTPMPGLRRSFFVCAAGRGGGELRRERDRGVEGIKK